MKNTSSLFRVLFFLLALSFSLSAQKIQVGAYSLRVNGTQQEKYHWGPSVVTYRVANDSLVFQVSEFLWDEKTKTAQAKGGEIPGEKLGHKNARIQLDAIQFEPANGTLRIVSADWIEGDQTKNGEGSLTLRRKDKYFSFEFRGSEPTTFTGEAWTAEGAPYYKDLRKGLRNGIWHPAFWEFRGDVCAFDCVFAGFHDSSAHGPVDESFKRKRFGIADGINRSVVSEKPNLSF
ncbi:MAG: hypothetical protein RIR57_1645 [Bacteroidota bacterium]